MWQVNCQDFEYPVIRRFICTDGTLLHEDGIVRKFSKSELLNHKRRLKIEVDGTRIKTYIDHRLVDTYKARENIGMGDIGMRADSKNQEAAIFDNFLVKEYTSSRKGKIVLQEDFEKGYSENFLTAHIINHEHSKACMVSSVWGDKHIMQSSFEGVPIFRKSFSVDKHLISAKLYTAALGTYDLRMNGQRVGHLQRDGSIIYEELKPGWSDYRHRVFYSTHDVTSLLRRGHNVLEATVSSGWFSGDVAHGLYGTDDDLSFIAKLLLRFDDGSEQWINTNHEWLVSKQGALRFCDIYDGVVYDARKEQSWQSSDSHLSEWGPVVINGSYQGQIESFKGPFVTVLSNYIQKVKTATIYHGSKPSGTDYGMVNVIQTQKGEKPISLKKGQTVIFDFGQNIVGWWNFTVKGKRGVRLHMQCSEMLNDDGSKQRGNDGPGGSLYLINLRLARAEVFYTLKGTAEGETWHPHGTFFGFRYCAVTATDDVVLTNIIAIPVSSSTEEAGTIETNSNIINQLISNVVWGQRGNLLSIPTDCPQRDERQGWTADTQVFATTGMFNANMQTFYRKWMTDMRDGQREDGAFPDTAPIGYSQYGGAGWSDAGIIVPWYIYRMYGDKSVLSENYSAMEKYMNWIAAQKDDGAFQGALTTYGDWLSYAHTDRRFVSMAYYAYDAQLMSRMSRVLSVSPDDNYARNSEKYERLFLNIRSAFQNRYVKNDTLTEKTQTTLLMALEYDLLVNNKQKAMAINQLEDCIRSNENKLSTGFLGTAIINGTLSKVGLSDRAYSLLLQRANPSWLYPIDQGATTMWERWDSYTRERGFNTPIMNSFNHYAYGAIQEWMYRYMCGISFDEKFPGFKHIVLQPTPDMRRTIPAGQERISNVQGSYESQYGKITASWNISVDNMFNYHCHIPANTTATLLLPAGSETALKFRKSVKENNMKGIRYIGYNNRCVILYLGSGSYDFQTKL